MKASTEHRLGGVLGVVVVVLVVLGVFAAVTVAVGDTKMSPSEVPPIETGCPGCSLDELQVHQALSALTVAATLSELREEFGSHVTGLDTGPRGTVVTVSDHGLAMNVCRWLNERSERIRVHDTEGILLAATRPWNGDCRPVHS